MKTLLYKLLCIFIITIFVGVPQVSAFRQQDIDCVTDGGTCHYDETDLCSGTGTATNPAAGNISGDLQSLAQQIWDNPSISYDFGRNGPTGTQFQRLKDGQKAQTDDGREVDVQPIILVTILHLAQGHTVNVSALTDGSSHTAPTNPHGSGKAVDINIFDGSHNNGSDAVANKIINLAAEVLPSGSRFGMGDRPFGTKQIAGKTFKSFADHPTHVHIDVLGVSQADNDAAVQAAGGGAPAANVPAIGSVAPTGSQGPVFILGDSITVGAQAEYEAAFQEKGATVEIDGSDSRSLTTAGANGNGLNGLDAITADSTKIAQASAIVIALGTNGGTTAANIKEAIKDIKAINPTAPIYWIDTISVGRSDDYNSAVIGPANRAINKAASSTADPTLHFQVISWFKAVDSDGDPLHPTQAEQDPNSFIVNGDQHVHPTAAGAKALAALVANTVDVSSGSGGTASCCPGGGGGGAPGTALNGSGTGEQVFNFFAVTHNLSNDAAAAATGNLQLESANWSVIDGWGGGGGNYYGIAQWSRNDRYVNLVKFAGGAANAAKLNYQLDFVWHELTTDYKSTLANLKSSSSLEDKTIFWGRVYEGALTNGALQMQKERIAYAQDWANKAGGGSPGTPAPATTGDANCTAAAGPGSAPGEYRNPFHDMSNVGPSRIDEGVDYFATTGKVPVYAIGNGEVTLATDKSTFFTSNTSGHSDWITYKLSDGPAAGKYIYVSESCTIDPDILSGKVKVVNTDTKLCDMLPASIEMGWADSPTGQYAAALSSYIGHHGWKTAYGVNFNELLVKLGAPPGHLGSGVPNQVTGMLPADWPKW